MFIGNRIGSTILGENASDVANNFVTRVTADGGVVESQSCLTTRIQTLKDKGIWDLSSAVWLPHGYKEGKLYAAKGGAGADFGYTRGGTRKRKGATYVEEVPYNLLQYSEQFDNASWLTVANIMAAPVVTANSTTDPDGNLTAEKVDLPASSGTGAYSLLQPNPSRPTSGNATYTLSVYLKGVVGGEVLWLIATPDAVTWAKTRCALTTSWQLFTLTYTTSGATEHGIEIGIDRRDSQQTEALGAQSFYISKIQLNKGTTRGDYFQTTDRFNVPALDYTNSTCPSLSLEPARTNLLLQSEAFDNASWTKIEATPTANAVAGPENLSTADRLLETTVNATHRVEQVVTKAASALKYSFTAYVKGGLGRDWVLLQCASGANGAGNWFNITTGIKGAARVVGAGWTLDNASITPSANGFYRLEVNVTSGTETTIECPILISPDGSTLSYAGDVTKGFYAYGAQLEQAPYATSYIKTEAATVSRVADAIPALTGVSSLIGQTEGTLYFEGSSFADLSGKDITISDGTTSNYIRFTFTYDAGPVYNVGATIVTGGVSQGGITRNFTTNTNYKIAVVYKSNYFAVFADGVKVGQDLTVVVPATAQIKFAHPDNTTPFYGNIRALVLSKTALTDAEAITLTQP